MRQDSSAPVERPGFFFAPTPRPGAPKAGATPPALAAVGGSHLLMPCLSPEASLEPGGSQRARLGPRAWNHDLAGCRKKAAPPEKRETPAEGRGFEKGRYSQSSGLPPSPRVAISAFSDSVK